MKFNLGDKVHFEYNGVSCDGFIVAASIAPSYIIQPTGTIFIDNVKSGCIDQKIVDKWNKLNTTYNPDIINMQLFVPFLDNKAPNPWIWEKDLTKI